MSTRFKLDVNLDAASVASVEDLAQLLRNAADQLASTCGTDCEFSPKCAKCWNDIRLTGADGTTVGTGMIVVE